MRRIGKRWGRESTSLPRWLRAGLASKGLAFGPKVPGLENAGGSDDAGDEFGRGHVEPGIARAAPRIGHPDVLALPLGIGSPGAENFRFGTFFNGNVAAGF